MIKKRIDLFEPVIGIILTFFALLIVVPFINVFGVSFSTEREYLLSTYMVFPSNPTLENYELLFKDMRILYGYRTTILFVIIGVPYNLFLTVCTAYALSKPAFPGKKFFMLLIVFTMYFSGGIIPMYLLIRSLGLTNTIWSVILPYGVSTFYMLITKGYIAGLPSSISESARIDGAGEWRVLFQIILPLSQPIIATFTLFYALDRWNEWFNSMVFIRSVEITPLQLVLRSIVLSGDYIQQMGDFSASLGTPFSKGLKMSAVMVTMLPIMLFYPFLQKYFVKGIMVGAIKG